MKAELSNSRETILNSNSNSQNMYYVPGICSSRFQKEISDMLGRRVSPGRAGRPRKARDKEKRNN